MAHKKKLIEVALPLEAINKASAREKSIRHGHPSTLHLWWARRPLAAARAVLFAQMVDDPSSSPDLFPTEKAQEKERQRLFRIIEDMVQWENTNNEEMLQAARDAIWESWRRTCAENVDHPQAKDLFNRYKLPAFHDPFAGGGSIPLEAQRLGLEAFASDLNPVAVLINKATIEIPPRFGGKPPVNPKARGDKNLVERKWCGAEGLADDIRYYGQWMRDEALKRIGQLYPKVEITRDLALQRPDLEPHTGKRFTVIAYLWARTVKSPNPAWKDVYVPLISTFILVSKVGREAYIEPIIEGRSYRFSVKLGKPKDVEKAKLGTKLGRGSNFRCIMSDIPIEADYIRAEACAGRMGSTLLALVVDGPSARLYLPASEEQSAIANNTHPVWKPDLMVPTPCHDVDRLPMYGMPTWGDAFTSRELVALTTFSDLVQEAMGKIQEDSILANAEPDYKLALGLYLGLAVSRTANTINRLSVWSQSREQTVNLFSRQAIAMAWDFPEVNPFAGAAGDFEVTTSSIAKTIPWTDGPVATVRQEDAQTQEQSLNKVVSTDPPYYDNVSYADLSDFFYVWLRRSLGGSFSELLSTLAVPKEAELIASIYRHGSKPKAEAFFLAGMKRALHQISSLALRGFPVTIYYAFKQSESRDVGKSSTGWETFLEALIQAGFAITGTWPIRTERPTGVKSGTNVLASSIVLVCRQLTECSCGQTTTRRDFITCLKTELPTALQYLQKGSIAPVDLAQSAIGPGMAIYTRYEQVLDASGKAVSVRETLALINQTLDEILTEQEGDFDADTRWALAWFDQQGFLDGEFGIAETLSKAKNTSVSGLIEAGILTSQRGRVRLLRPNELPVDWDPAKDKRLTVWEMVHHLIRLLESGGETPAAELAAKLGSQAETARELAYRLYSLCERKKRPAEALSYNALVQSWPEIMRLARETNQPEQAELFAGREG